jgi:hypothetical protein
MSVNGLRWFYLLESEWLKALVLKAVDKPQSIINQGFRRCPTSAFFLVVLMTE